MHSRKTEQPIHHFHLCLLGDSGVGKSCLTKQFINNTFTQDYIPKIISDVNFKNIEMYDDIFKCGLWEGDCTQFPRSFLTPYFKRMNAILLIFSLADQKSFENVKSLWLRYARDYADNLLPIFIVATKSDLEYSLDIGLIEGFLRTECLPFYEVSAKNTTPTDMFTDILQILISKKEIQQNRQRKVKSSSKNTSSFIKIQVPAEQIQIESKKKKRGCKN